MDTTDTGRGGRYHLDATGAVIRADADPGAAATSPLPPDPTALPAAADAKPAGKRRSGSEAPTTEPQE